MSKSLRFFLTSFLISLPFWWAANIFQEGMESFLFWKKMADNPQIILAQMVQEENLASLKPIRNRQQEIEDLQLEAESGISVFIDNQGSEKVIFAKDAQKQLPIASLTKLMTASVVLEYYGTQQEELVHFLYPLLISSNNNTAVKIADQVGQESFVELMNLQVERLGLENTYFANSTGLDPEEEQGLINYSTAEELVKFAKYLKLKQPLIWEITKIQAFEDNVNTNELLAEIPHIVGGKTGWTEKARGCLIILMEDPRGRGLVVNVILGSSDRFGDMRKLIDWINSAYNW